MTAYESVLGLLVVHIIVYYCCTVYAEKLNFTVVFDTEYGPVRGVKETLPNGKDMMKFLGIPYASARRWQPPKSYRKWTSTLDAVKPIMCPQTGQQVATGEDCLALNIYLPFVGKGTGSLAVLVFINGGGFRVGGGGSSDASVLVAEQRIIVVTINHRLGALGFLRWNSQGIQGNYGMMDQIEALKWIQRNIERFGGDPRRVTIAGQSAGGESVSLLMLSPLAAGLYSNAIAMSGTAVHILARHKDEIMRTARSFGDAIGCTDKGDINSCLQNKTTAEILAAQQQVSRNFKPCVDGHLIPDTNVLKDGKIRRANVMVGITNDDGSFLYLRSPGLQGSSPNKGITRDIFLRILTNTTWVSGQARHVTSALEQAYTDWSDPSNPNTTRAMLVDMFTDSWILVPTVVSARVFAKESLNTFLYYFEQRPSSGRLKGKLLPPWIRAPHGAELGYLFGGDADTNFSANMTGSEKEDREFAKTFRTLVANFVKMGDPNEASLPKWPRFTSAKQEYLRVKPKMSVGSSLRADKVHLWTEFLPTLTSDDGKPTTDPVGAPTAAPTTPPQKRDKVIVALALTSVIFVVLSIVLFIMLIYTCVRVMRLARIAKGGYSAELIEKSNTEGS